MHMHCVEKAFEVFPYIVTVVMDSSGNHGFSHLSYMKHLVHWSLNFWWIENLTAETPYKDSKARYRQIGGLMNFEMWPKPNECQIIITRIWRKWAANFSNVEKFYIRWSYLTIVDVKGATKAGEGKDPLPVLGVKGAEDLCFAVGHVVSLREEFEEYFFLLVVPGPQLLPDPTDPLPEILNDSSN